MKYKEHDILIRDLTSKKAWIVRDVDGKLMAVPLGHSDGKPEEIQGDYLKLGDPLPPEEQLTIMML